MRVEQLEAVALFARRLGKAAAEAEVYGLEFLMPVSVSVDGHPFGFELSVGKGGEVEVWQTR